VEVETLPALPCALGYMTGAKVGDSIYVAGGQETVADARATTHFFRLDLSKEGTPGFGWEELSAWPGPGRVVAVSCGLGSGAEAAFYLFSGRDVQPGKIPEPLGDAYRYRVATGRWEALPAIRPEGASAGGRCVMGGAAVAAGAHTMRLLGGDDGVMFTALEQIRRQIAQAGDGAERTGLEGKLREMLENHQGFSRDVVEYDAVSGRYSVVGVMPQPAPVTTPCVPWRGGLLMPSGEVRPGVRSPAVWLGRAGAVSER
jgi:N-acetylneuraminic acid mutarotase